MAVYNNTNKTSSLTSVEFTPVADGNIAFFHVDSAKNKDQVKQWLSAEVGQHILAETSINGKPVFVTQGNRSEGEMVKMLQAGGEKLEFVPPPKKPIDTWKLIAALAVPGQMMQMGSALTQVGKKLDWGLFVFAASNLLGHAIGWNYGSQKPNDEHQEDFVKASLNKKFSEHLPPGGKLPDIQDNRLSMREGEQPPQTFLQKANDFLHRNSVTFGEIFLRYFGAFALAFPVNRWGKALTSVKQGDSIKKVWETARNPTLTHYAGLMSLFGKTIALFSKVHDPYNPDKHTWFDTMREKYAFRAGGWIEALAFGTMTYDAIQNKDRKILFGDHGPYRDYLGIVGSAMFTVRYIVRHWAKYGEKTINMDELNAHITDSLAQMPRDKIPQLMAETTADLVEHFKDKNLNFGQVYTQLMNDVYKYHHIPLKPTAAPPPTPTLESTTPPAPSQKPTLAVAPRPLIDRTNAPSESYASSAKTEKESSLSRVG